MRKNNIHIIGRNYVHPQYSQPEAEFVRYHSIIDLLFNCGPNSLEIEKSSILNEDNIS